MQYSGSNLIKKIMHDFSKRSNSELNPSLHISMKDFSHGNCILNSSILLYHRAIVYIKQILHPEYIVICLVKFGEEKLELRELNSRSQRRACRVITDLQTIIKGPSNKVSSRKLTTIKTAGYKWMLDTS